MLGVSFGQNLTVACLGRLPLSLFRVRSLPRRLKSNESRLTQKYRDPW
jgi:hypothetical protein